MNEIAKSYLNSIGSIKIWCLMAAVLAYSLCGWYLVAGLIPLYVIPLGLGCLVLALEGKWRALVPPELRLVVWLVGGLIAWSMAGLIVAEHLQPALFWTAGWIMNLAILLFTLSTSRTWRERQLLLWTYFSIHTAGLGLAGYQALTETGFLTPPYQRTPPAGFEGMSFLLAKNYLPIFALGAAACLLKARVASFRPLIRPNWWLMIAILGVVVSTGRSTILGMVVGCLLLTALFRKWPERLLWGLLVVFLAGCLFLSPKVERDSSEVNGHQVNSSQVVRSTAYSGGLKLLQENPVFGIGGGNFKYRLEDVLTPNERKALVECDVSPQIAPHNVFLGIVVNMGWPGLILFAAFLGYCIWLSIFYYLKCDDLRVQWISVSTALYLLMYSVDLNFHNYFDDNNMWVFLGVFFASIASADVSQKSTPGPTVLLTPSGTC